MSHVGSEMGGPLVLTPAKRSELVRFIVETFSLLRNQSRAFSEPRSAFVYRPQRGRMTSMYHTRVSCAYEERYSRPRLTKVFGKVRDCPENFVSDVSYKHAPDFVKLTVIKASIQTTVVIRPVFIVYTISQLKTECDLPHNVRKDRALCQDAVVPTYRIKACDRMQRK